MRCHTMHAGCCARWVGSQAALQGTPSLQGSAACFLLYQCVPLLSLRWHMSAGTLIGNPDGCCMWMCRGPGTWQEHWRILMLPSH
jgi:hypothetical protein